MERSFHYLCFMTRVHRFNRSIVVEQAMLQFWQAGFHGTSMQQLVNATGLNRSSLYNSFGDKLHLYKTCIKYYQGFDQHQLQIALDHESNEIEALKTFFQKKFFSSKGTHNGCFLQNVKYEMASEIFVKTMLENHQERILILLEKIILKGQGSGTINQNKGARVYAWHVYNSYQGYCSTSVLVDDPKILSEITNCGLSIIK